MSPDEILEILMAGNKIFVENKRTNYNTSIARLTEVATGQKPFASIVYCADYRVPVEIIFDRGLGGLFVLRDAGNIANTEEIGSIEFGTLVLGSKVLYHVRIISYKKTFFFFLLPSSFFYSDS